MDSKNSVLKQET